MNQLKIATLSKEDVSKIRTLEQETGFHIMAFEPGYKFAAPDAEQLTKVKKLEEELGVTLLAYEE